MQPRGLNILEVHHGWDEDEPGGIVAMMKDLMDGLAVQGHRVTLLANDWNSTRLHRRTDRDGRDYYRLNLAPVPAGLTDVHALIGCLWRFPVALWGLWRLCKKQRIDLIQLHYADSLYLVFAALRMLGGPLYIVTVHGGDVGRYADTSRFRRVVYQRVMTGAACVVAVSSSLGRKAQGVSPQLKRLAVINNGYTPRFQEPLTRDQLNAGLGLELPDSFATLVGNCRPVKGHDVALEAWAHLRDEGPLLPLLIVGGGPNLAAMRELCTSLGLDDCVTFVGPRSRHVAASLTAHATLQVVPSRNEGQGIVILEAGYAGTPVICSDIEPFLEMVEPGVTASVFPVENASMLAARVREALLDPDATRAMGQRLRRHVLDHFSSATMVSHYSTLFQSVVRGGS